MMGATVTRDILIEDLVKIYPQAVGFLTKKGIRCIRCGEPLWCTLGELLHEEGIQNPENIIDELKRFLE